MELKEFTASLVAWYILFPAAVLCLAPMRNQTRLGMRRTMVLAVAVLCVLAALTALLETLFSAGYNTFLLPLLLICFFAYHKSLRVPLCKSLSVFVQVCVMMAFLANVANGYDAFLHPTLTLNQFTLEAATFQAWITTFAATLLFLPLRSYGARMVDHFDLARVWYATLPVDALFLGFNLFVSPRKYETLHVNHVFLTYWRLLLLMLALFCLLAVLFYEIVRIMLKASKTAKRNQLLEMQGSQYRTVMHYLDSSAKARHDFRHTIHTLQELSREKKYAEMDKYLAHYAAALPVNEVHAYCRNDPLNALLNYYAQTAALCDISLRLKVELPDEDGVSDMDLCGIVGNIMENAVAACMELKDDRQISLTITVPLKNSLCIVASNTFNGELREENGRYLSTHHSGNAIGLDSIASTAKRYGGVAQFRHEGSLFYSDVMLMTDGTQDEDD